MIAVTICSASQALASAPVPVVIGVQATSQLSAQWPGSLRLQVSLRMDSSACESTLGVRMHSEAHGVPAPSLPPLLPQALHLWHSFPSPLSKRCF